MDVTTGSQPQKGVVTYGLSANRQRPLAGTLNAAIFNTWRRFSHQVLYFAPPLVIAYYTMQWAIERFVPMAVHVGVFTNNGHRNEYLNSKAGRLEFGEEE
jgi:ubiquinol-cytochrome c reductase subunit 8